MWKAQLVVSGRFEFVRWFDWVFSVGSGCIGAFLIFMFLPGLVAQAVTGDAELGQRLVRLLTGWGFGPLAVVCGLYWFAVPYWRPFSMLTRSWGTRWTAVGMGTWFWGIGTGPSARVLGARALFAVWLGLRAGLTGLLTG